MSALRKALLRFNLGLIGYFQCKMHQWGHPNTDGCETCAFPRFLESLKEPCSPGTSEPAAGEQQLVSSQPSGSAGVQEKPSVRKAWLASLKESDTLPAHSSLVEVSGGSRAFGAPCHNSTHLTLEGILEFQQSALSLIEGRPQEKRHETGRNLWLIVFLFSNFPFGVGGKHVLLVHHICLVLADKVKLRKEAKLQWDQPEAQCKGAHTSEVAWSWCVIRLTCT